MLSYLNSFSVLGRCLLCFRLLSNESFLLSSASLSLVGDNPLPHKLRPLAATDVHLKVMLYTQHITFQWVFDSSQSGLDSKLISSKICYRKKSWRLWHCVKYDRPQFFSDTFFCIRTDTLRLWSHLLKTSLIENFIFCTV